MTLGRLGEPGMFVGLIQEQDPTRLFHGYVSGQDSQKKIIRDVFQKGDSAFSSGDILVMDELGYMYFKDRTGDTFRWKGENVATSEVEAVVSSVASLRDAIVYGVEVGDLEGKAGMAALVAPDWTPKDLENFAAKLDQSLPSYARPLFLRLMTSVELTGTYKLRKLELAAEGFNPSRISDSLYLRQGRSFVSLTPELHHQVLAGRVRL